MWRCWIPMSPPSSQGFGNFIYNIPTNNMGAWFQDDWKVTKKLTLNLGVRYDNDLGHLQSRICI